MDRPHILSRKFKKATVHNEFTFNQIHIYYCYFSINWGPGQYVQHFYVVRSISYMNDAIENRDMELEAIHKIR